MRRPSLKATIQSRNVMLGKSVYKCSEQGVTRLSKRCMERAIFQFCLLPTITQAQSSMPKRVEPHRSKVGSMTSSLLNTETVIQPGTVLVMMTTAIPIDHTDVPLWFGKVFQKCN